VSTRLHGYADLLRCVGAQQPVVNLDLNLRGRVGDWIDVHRIDRDPVLIILQTLEDRSLNLRAQCHGVPFVEKILQSRP
jgi:hypothetical protein